jgi:hypothetical protein
MKRKNRNREWQKYAPFHFCIPAIPGGQRAREFFLPAFALICVHSRLSKIFGFLLGMHDGKNAL